MKLTETEELIVTGLKHFGVPAKETLLITMALWSQGEIAELKYLDFLISTNQTTGKLKAETAMEEAVEIARKFQNEDD